MKRRPAETSGAAGAVGLLVARLVGVRDPDVIVAMGAVIGLVPAVVTAFLEAGGLRGVVALVVRGRR